MKKNKNMKLICFNHSNYSSFVFNIYSIFVKSNIQVLNDITEKKPYIVTSYVIQLESIMVFRKFEISFPARRLFLLNGKC